MSNSDIFIGEMIGTAVLILLGTGVGAAVVLKRSKAQGAGWAAIAFGWGFAIMTAVYISNSLSGAHLNPAITLGIAITSEKWSNVPVYFAGQLLGAMIGAFLVWVAYYGQFKTHLANGEMPPAGAAGGTAVAGRDLAHRGDGRGKGRHKGTTASHAPGARKHDAAVPPPADEGLVDKTATPKAGPVLGIFATGPEIRVVWQNLATEIIGTAVLVLTVLTQGLNDSGRGLGAVGGLLVALVVASIGLSLGGPTGFAINPARDLGPRIVHALLPMPNKGGSDWTYAWIPVAGPLIGGALAAGIYQIAFA